MGLCMCQMGIALNIFHKKGNSFASQSSRVVKVIRIANF